ncbi:hypothetical protein Ngar_c32460 [Candidatus Nitrososphaera gargensis Ga9.2]|uniref:Uncharacterized protein n=2 Tax=Candidatus Nitrososphaera gargensis TaxID=497727 RepID=K0IMB8_NITGG|nr:hypothetical protein Ngar_c32460 [Candidatus Nitrososphaera gargensis Ga9.2]
MKRGKRHYRLISVIPVLQPYMASVSSPLNCSVTFSNNRYLLGRFSKIAQLHGHPWLENPILSIALIAVGFVLLFISLYMMKREPKHGYNLERKIAGHKILDTSNRWMVFSAFIGLVAIGAHYLAEYALHIYDITPVDRITHGISGMAVAAAILNANLTRGRRVYYPTAIGVSWAAFIIWEVYELLSVMFDPNTNIETGPWDLGIDLWIDTLGALAICFIYDEFNEQDQ